MTIDSIVSRMPSDWGGGSARAGVPLGIGVRGRGGIGGSGRGCIVIAKLTLRSSRRQGVRRYKWKEVRSNDGYRPSIFSRRACSPRPRWVGQGRARDFREIHTPLTGERQQVMADRSIVQIVVNPVAGRIASGAGSPGGRAVAVLRSRIEASGLEVRTVETRQRGDAWAIAGEACRQGARALVVVGGDGTVNEAVGGMTGEGVPILVVPVGTENILAKYLGIRLDGDALWRVLERGREIVFDVAVLDGGAENAAVGFDRTSQRQFLLVAGVGFEAQIVHEVTRRRIELLRDGGGHISYWTYIKPAWRTLSGYRHPKLIVEVDGKPFYSGRSIVLVGNVPRYAMGFRPAQLARPDDGLLDVCVFECRRRTTVLRHFANLVLRRHLRSAGVFYSQGRRVRICAEEEHVPVQTDGDVAGWLPAEFSMSERHARLLAPESFRM
jgi:diacylglycerol kinase (ATP)